MAHSALPTPSDRAPGALFVGLMSGTSLDGVDAVLADFSGPQPVQLAHHYLAFDDDFRETLAALCTPGENEIERAGLAAQSLARQYAAAVTALMTSASVAASDVCAIGAHGQTIRHRPALGFTVQLNAPAMLAELTGVDVVADFRSRDIAAGGQGAPLVSGFHALAFRGQTPRAIINVGGISNVTALPAIDDTNTVITGFDCGPGNGLIDGWAQRHFNRPYDQNGDIAAGAEHDEALLEQLLAEPFFSQSPPKSTGRELFTLQWLDHRLGADRHDPQVVIATLTRLTARSIAQSIARWCPQATRIYVCGGGVRNRTLMSALVQEAGDRAVCSTEELGIEPQCVEALAFAWLAHAYIERSAGNIASVTGARGPRILGALYPAGQPLAQLIS